MGTPKVMRLIDPSEDLMECKVCGSVHKALFKTGGGFYRGAWQCQHGCQLEDGQDPDEPPADDDETDRM